MVEARVSAAHASALDSAPERFVGARRSGYPAWLWPDVPVENWQLAGDEIARIAASVLAGDRNLFLPSRDANAMGLAGYTSGMGPLLGSWIESGIIGTDSTTDALFRRHLSHNRIRMARLSRAMGEATGKLNVAGITPLVLKGMHTAFRYFPEPGTRPLSDIDLYIPMECMTKAERIFSDLGYRRALRTRSPYACDWIPPGTQRSPRTLTFVHEDDPWSIDVLGTVDRRLPTGQSVNLANLLSCTEPADRCSGASTMRQPLLTLYLAVHMSQTLLNVTVLRAVELALVIRCDTARGAFDWNEVLRGAALIGGARFIYPALMFTRQLAPQTIPDDVVVRARADAPNNLRQAVERLTIASAQPIRRHSVSERFMWAGTWREGARQVATELFIDGQGRPFADALSRIGSKLWALGRGRYTR